MNKAGRRAAEAQKPRPVWPASATQTVDWPRLIGAWGSMRHALALREAPGEPAGRSGSLVTDTGAPIWLLLLITHHLLLTIFWHRSAELAVNKVQRGANKEVRPASLSVSERFGSFCRRAPCLYAVDGRYTASLNSVCCVETDGYPQTTTYGSLPSYRTRPESLTYHLPRRVS